MTSIAAPFRTARIYLCLRALRPKKLVLVSPRPMGSEATRRDADELNVLEKAMDIMDPKLMQRVSLKFSGCSLQLTVK